MPCACEVQLSSQIYLFDITSPPLPTGNRHNCRWPSAITRQMSDDSPGKVPSDFPSPRSSQDWRFSRPFHSTWNFFSQTCRFSLDWEPAQPHLSQEASGQPLTLTPRFTHLWNPKADIVSSAPFHTDYIEIILSIIVQASERAPLWFSLNVSQESHYSWGSGKRLRGHFGTSELD